MHGLCPPACSTTPTATPSRFAARIDAAIARLAGLEILRKTRDDEDSYTISPVITAIMTASVDHRTAAAVRAAAERRSAEEEAS